MTTIVTISKVLLPSDPGRVLPDTWYAKREKSGSVGTTVDMDQRIRIIAAHPDGGFIYMEVGPDAPTELKRMSTDDLRSWQLLPTPLTQTTLAAKLGALRNGGDHEEAAIIYLEALTTIAVYDPSGKEAAELAKAVLEGTRGE